MRYQTVPRAGESEHTACRPLGRNIVRARADPELAMPIALGEAAGTASRQCSSSSEGGATLQHSAFAAVPLARERERPVPCSLAGPTFTASSSQNGPPNRRPVRNAARDLGRCYFSTRARTTPMMRTLGAVWVMIPIQVLRNRFVG